MESFQYKILVADDNKDFLDSVIAALKTFHVITASSIDSAKKYLSNNIDLVLLDLVFDDRSPDDLQGLKLLKHIHDNYPELQIIIMTNYSSTDIIVQAMKAGASDFLNKGELNWIEWKIRLTNYCKQSQRIKVLTEKAYQLENKYDDSEIIGISPQIDYVRRRLKDLAENTTESSIFITGETGTGKNLAVKYFRKYSNKDGKAYKEFSISEKHDEILESELFGHVRGAFSGAIDNKKGLFEEANGGILFLDEIGDCDIDSQIKILRFIEDKTITPVGGTQCRNLDVQLIMATNKDIRKLIQNKLFREDLFQRINRIRVELPALRNRKEDIKYLTDYFFNHFKEKEKTDLKLIDSEVYKIFESYDWPGNIRELQSVILDACTRARLYNDTILSLKYIRNEILETKDSFNYSENDQLESDYKVAIIRLQEIEDALKEHNGSKSKAAKSISLNLDNMRYRVNKYLSLIKNGKEKFPTIIKVYNMEDS